MITDPYGRQFKKLRVSLLNTCNFACTYCVPEENYMLEKKHLSFWDINKVNAVNKPLSYNELKRHTEALHEVLTFEEIHLTGGEPLLYPRIISLVRFLRSLGIENIKLTTNGLYLRQYGHKLKEAGITGINVSLDAIDYEVFQRITKRNYLNKVLEGIDNVLFNNIELKLNAVIMRGINDNQIIPMLDYARQKNIVLRYIELMNMGHLYDAAENYFYPAREILDTITREHSITAKGRVPSGTATYWRTGDGYEFGIIANETFPFCNDCDRLRLDSQGKLYGCITARQGIDIKDSNQADDYKVLLERAMAQKQPTKFSGNKVSMLQLGG